jgi:hypothetical protein
MVFSCQEKNLESGSGGVSVCVVSVCTRLASMHVASVFMHVSADERG